MCEQSRSKRRFRIYLYKYILMKKEERITIRLSAETKDKLKIIAEQDRRSISNYIILLIEKHIENEIKK